MVQNSRLRIRPPQFQRESRFASTPRQNRRHLLHRHVILPTRGSRDFEDKNRRWEQKPRASDSRSSPRAARAKNEEAGRERGLSCLCGSRLGADIEKAFGIRPKELAKNKEFMWLVERSGLKLAAGEKWVRVSKKPFVNHGRKQQQKKRRGSWERSRIERRWQRWWIEAQFSLPNESYWCSVLWL